MESIKIFRHEFKYVISKREMYEIISKLKDILTVDQKEDGYMVRSLYFDSINNKDYYDKLAGNLVRKKIRLRIYSHDSDKVKLEMKEKIDMHQLKETLLINKIDVLKLMNQDYSILLNYHSDIANKLYLDLRLGCYLPKCIIEYKRIAFISRMNTRITFDFDIMRAKSTDNFFDRSINYDRIDDPTKIVMEVKFDRFLEPYIGKILSKFETDNQSVSKYIMGRS